MFACHYLHANQGRHSGEDISILSDISLPSPKLCISSEGEELWSESLVHRNLNPDHIQHDQTHLSHRFYAMRQMQVGILDVRWTSMIPMGISCILVKLRCINVLVTTDISRVPATLEKSLKFRSVSRSWKNHWISWKVLEICKNEKIMETSLNFKSVGNWRFLSWNIIEKSLKFFEACPWEPW